MKLTTFKWATKMNIFDYTVPKQGEQFDTLLEHKNVKILRIVSSSDFEPTEYIQDEDEWVVLLKGEATLLVGQEKKVLKEGDSLFIPAYIAHTVLRMKHDTIWIAVHIY